ncbi:segregation/condensation protein A, partial [Candidatus Sumerlaeota bacterium]|nr:segregation/condensation protein A [Candidatus Sumerlaeota bacterium]
DGLRGDLDTMLTAFSRVLRFVEARGWHMVTEEEYSVEEKIDFIHRRIQAEKQLDIEGLFRDCRSKVEMIVVLLALLELCRQKSIAIKQGDPYGAVHIYKRDVLTEESPVQTEAIKPEDAIPDRPTAQIVEFAGEEEDEDVESLGLAEDASAEKPDPVSLSESSEESPKDSDENQS